MHFFQAFFLADELNITYSAIASSLIAEVYLHVSLDFHTQV